ncbi:O-antigen ligase family protein [Bifidobacterium imperatoris]|uniref:O-antigen ligase family protein n=2 Tax=Bifidobacterium imperatoris TaxID=2020965 RepID=A0A2N5IPE4_9BIFI|nr:o-antigen polymerase [Bifidobacterium imperatoris]QSY58082.1 O-antigen ligase family protein [Bifidobacterium imperatoris]
MKFSKNLQIVFIALAIIPFFQNAIGYKYPPLGLVVQFSRFFFFTICIALILINASAFSFITKNIKIYLIIALIFTFICSAIVNNTNVVAVLQLSLYILYPFLLFSVWSHSPVETLNICKGVTYGLNILVLVNLVMMLCFPQGLFQTVSSDTVSYYYLFGAKNQMVAPIMTCLFFNAETAYRSYNKIVTKTSLFMSLICTLELIIGGSGTGLIVLFVFIVLCLLELKHRTISPNLSLIVLLASFLGIVVFRIQNIFSFLIVDVLHKSLTLSDRTYIWDSAIESILSHLILGTGITDSLSGNVHLKLSYLVKDIFAHDLYLDYLLMGGVPALCIFICLLISVKNSYCYILNRNRTFIWWGIVIYLFASIVEIYTTNFCLFLMFAYMSICDYSIRHGHLI